MLPNESYDPSCWSSSPGKCIMPSGPINSGKISLGSPLPNLVDDNGGGGGMSLLGLPLPLFTTTGSSTAGTSSMLSGLTLFDIQTESNVALIPVDGDLPGNPLNNGFSGETTGTFTGWVTVWTSG